jgi:hypothetical protein
MSDIESQSEKHPQISNSPHIVPATETGFVDEVLLPHNSFQRWALKLETKMGLEARGIERVPEELRAKQTRPRDYVQMGIIWFSANLTANNTMLGLLGPGLFLVGLKDAMVTAAFGAMVGAMATAYISTFGPVSGNRTLVGAPVLNSVTILTNMKLGHCTVYDGLVAVSTLRAS